MVRVHAGLRLFLRRVLGRRRGHRLAEVWHEVEVHIHDQYLREHAARLAADRRTLNTAIRNAAAVGKGS